MDLDDEAREIVIPSEVVCTFVSYSSFERLIAGIQADGFNLIEISNEPGEGFLVDLFSFDGKIYRTDLDLLISSLQEARRGLDYPLPSPAG